MQLGLQLPPNRGNSDAETEAWLRKQIGGLLMLASYYTQYKVFADAVVQSSLVTPVTEELLEFVSSVMETQLRSTSDQLRTWIYTSRDWRRTISDDASIIDCFNEIIALTLG